MSKKPLAPKPELLMPAGSLQKLEYAYAYGADAVYIGVPFFSLRARENDFTYENLLKAREIADAQGKKIYVTINIFAKNRKLKPFHEQIEKIIAARPDALIMSDPGMMLMVREIDPDIPIHLSVQANCMNWMTVKFWKEKMGVTRVILSRELNINEIREIKQRVPEIELEAFVHGSICIAYSGRCLMSSYMSRRDANNGVCDNSCREKYNVYEVKAPSSDYYLEDLRNKGELYQINEDENGTFLMNAKDLRLIHHLKEIAEAGVCSFKVEGRTKSLNYVSLVSKAYREAIDLLWDGKEIPESLIAELDKVANRGYSTGFMVQENPGAEAQNYDTSVSRNFSQRFAGLIQKKGTESPEGFLPVEVRNKITQGQECELISPHHESRHFTVTEILNSRLERVDSAHGGAGLYYFKTHLSDVDYGLLSLKQSHNDFL